jgi:hypothetical protein
MHFFLFKLKTNLKRILQYKSNIINAREYRRGVHQRRIQRPWQQDEEKHNTIRVGHHYAQTIPKNVNKTCALIQTTVGKDEPNAVFFFVVVAEVVTDFTTSNSKRKDTQ